MTLLSHGTVKMLLRTAQATLDRMAAAFRVITITGPRQSGKTTLARAAFPRKPYVSLEAADERAFALQDPRGFLARFPDGAVIDEAQWVPDLFSYIQTLVDEDQRPGRFVLTGSQNFGLLARITQSLAGRVGIVHLLPLSIAELTGGGVKLTTLDEWLIRGFYPALYDGSIPPHGWHAAYVTTYVERDVRQIINIQDLNVFQRFVALCAARTGQILNIASLATDSSISQSTARAWLGVLETSYIIHLLQPHHENLGKRLIKSPKLYFLDTGLAAFLMGIQDASHLAIHSARPALFETFVVSEFLKQRFNAGLRSNLYFWRDNVGTEVDVVVEDGRGLFAIEIKSGMTFQSDFVRALGLFSKYAGAKAYGSGLVYGGDESYTRLGVSVRSWRDL